jgi:hypothetical protein
MFIALALCACGGQGERNESSALTAKRALVVQRGRAVMPFDIDRTTHHFRKSASGGVQQVVSKDGDPWEIALIRKHLAAEAGRFQHGDFSDPSNIHGPEMPGLKALATGARRIDIRYTELPSGAQIAYETRDPTLVSAIHTWFDAQVQEHGRHAMPM